MSAPRYTREERLAQIRQLLARGLTQAEIATELGISRGAIRETLYDPTGEKARARKRRYCGRCVDCGAATCGSDGREKAPQRCAACRKAFERAQKKWTRDAVIAAIQRWAAEHGRPPIAADWVHGGGGDRPITSQVYRSRYSRKSRRSHSQPFASWAEAIEAAGFQPLRQGQRTPEGQARVSAAIAKRQVANAYWKHDRIIEAIREWTETHGAPPTSYQWRHAGESRPTASHVYWRFGSWPAALEAAGVASLATRERVAA